MRSQLANAVLGILTLILLGFFGYLAIRSIAGARPEIATAGIALITALAIPAVTNYFQRRQQIEADQRERKAGVYENFLDIYFDQMLETIIKTRQQNSQNVTVTDDILRSIHNLNKKLILWGSDDVVREYSAYRQEVIGNGPGKPRELPYALTGLEDILYAIRKDLGYANKKLGERELLALFVNDMTEPTPEAPRTSTNPPSNRQAPPRRNRPSPKDRRERRRDDS
jgi:hypothetical protein